MTFNQFDSQYKIMLKELALLQPSKQNRTAIKTSSVFCRTLRFSLNNKTVPLISLKKIHWKSVVEELLWILRGDTNIKTLTDKGVTIWNEWANENGDLGPVYGAQLRCFNGIDQLAYVQSLLRNDPDSRRIVVSYWNPSDLPSPLFTPQENSGWGFQALAPCHMLWELYSCTNTDENTKDSYPRRLSLKITQRSADVILGVPFNIASYGILLRMLAHNNDMFADELIWSGGDCHLYCNAVEAAEECVKRESYPECEMQIVRKVACISEYTIDDLVLNNYQHHPAIKVQVAI